MSFTPQTIWVGVALALSTLLVPAPLTAFALAVLFTAAIVDALMVRDPPRVDADLPQLLARAVPGHFAIAADPTRASHVRVRQAVVPDVTVEPNEADDRLTGTITAFRRGRHSLPSVAVRLDGPLGLGRWSHTDVASHDVVVYPDMPAARRLALAVREGRLRDARARGELGLGTDFESIREYLPDDDIRRVNWAATARTGRPMSNQYRIEQDRDVVCLIDCGRLMAAPLEDRTRLDAAIDAAVAVAAVADVAGDHSGLIAFDDEIRRHLRPRRAGALPMARALYDLEASDRESDYELAFRSVGSSKRSLIIVFTDIVEESAARPLLDAVPVLTRHHHVVIASVMDTDLVTIAATEPNDARDVYAAVVAGEVLDARARIARAMRLARADVVEATPQALGGECVRRYLRAKARARL